MDLEPSIPCRKIRCPKCGGEPVMLGEAWRGHCIEFNYANGKRGLEGILGEGNPYAVWATCQCGHEWRLRGITQITELDTQEE